MGYSLKSSALGGGNDNVKKCNHGPMRFFHLSQFGGQQSRATSLIAKICVAEKKDKFFIFYFYFFANKYINIFFMCLFMFVFCILQ